jgi:hypothetical protein
MIEKTQEGAPIYIAPEELEEHKGMLDVAYEYVMMRRYKDLDQSIKDLINRHIKEREQLSAQLAAPPATAAAPGMPAPMGLPGMPPM